MITRQGVKSSALETDVTSKFLLSGATKCGKTAMKNRFAEYAEYWLASPREPQCGTGECENHLLGYSDIGHDLKMFRVTPGTKIIGEVSASIIRSDNALPGIDAYHSRVKFLPLGRNPIAIVRSLNRERAFSSGEHQSGFEDRVQSSGTASSRRFHPFALLSSSKVAASPCCFAGISSTAILRYGSRATTHGDCDG